ncbi:MAG: hypothetical protein COZ12_07185 [Deltaproteobacteria bacterium CG_4_10_14_3_um_filter_60_8]|nr:MAG: hypothetical protein AUK28_10010 [Desulfobacterales bacterium CG2_30_60_27]PIY20977.1 MAG: hypothetical protein COZ12_07185 [Deltaproteobacteria bacterium CG_4_10_14_3_um_filter_60_8]
MSPNLIHANKKRMVHSCDFLVQKEDKVTLEAWLATCVAVALVDRQAGLGGLIHLLLPEPTGTDIAFQPATYASTGLPLLISGLRAAGAALSRLEASVAGGSLVAPVSAHDMRLNIGGRTTDVALAILAQAGIPVAKAEIGGYGHWKLSLDCWSWETSIAPLWQPGQDPPLRQAAPDLTPDGIGRAIAMVRPIPQIALKIIQLTQDGDYAMAGLAAEVRQDQFMSGRVLSLCNSAFLAHRGHIDSVQGALSLLGERKFVQIAMAACLEGMLPESPWGYSLCRGGLFHHALGTARVAEELARFTGRADAEVAFTAGLLHDIGKIILDQYLAASSPYFYRTVHAGGRELCEVEHEQFGIDHTDMGRRLGEEWALPDNLIEVISHHHDPEHATLDRDLVTLVYLADLLMAGFQPGCDLGGMNSGQLVANLGRVGLTPEQFPVIADRMPRNIFMYNKHQEGGAV